MQTQERKIIIIGDSDLGKTTFCKRLIDNSNNYLSNQKTLGVDVSPYETYINNRKIRLNLWDCAGDERYKGLGVDYWIDAHGALIFKNNENNNHLRYKNHILNKCGHIPIIYIDYDINNNINNYMQKINELVNLL